MKKVLLFVAVATVSLASCKKDRTCTCTTTSSSGTSTQVITMHEVKKGDARENCIGTQTTTTAGGGTFVGDDTTCKLD